MIRKISGIILLITLFLVSFKISKALENFTTTVNAEYKVQEDGVTLVTNTISIKNNKSNLYPKKFILNISGADPQNIKVYELGRLLPVLRQDNNGITSLVITFEQPAVGKNNAKTFVITYDDKTLAQKTGEIWELTVPKIDNSDTFDEFKTTVSVPKLFGDEAYISPEPDSRKEVEDRILYTFGKNKLGRAGVSAGFGKFQVFKFNLFYHLENTTDAKAISKIALPPDTSTQKMFYDSILPKPSNITLDEDGNWIAEFLLLPKEKFDVEAKGQVQIFSSPRRLHSENNEYLEKSKLPTAFWQTDDPSIKKVASELKTPLDIYNFVSKTLKYDIGKIGGEAKRQGAKAALENPQASLCTEFTDTFIALARANGIPAREINGFAYSQNPDIEPLSLVSDVLHSWPEYWDEARKVWVPIDPTWASTTGGVDFFNKFDLRHFAFVIHGVDPEKPYSAGSYMLGTEPEKDVFVTFGNLPEKRYPEINLKEVEGNNFPLISKKVNISIDNTGPVAAYDNLLDIYLGSRSVETEEIKVLLPFTAYSKTININYGFMGSKAPEFIKVRLGSKEIEIENGKSSSIVNQLLAMSTIFIFALILYLLYNKKTHLALFKRKNK